MMKVDILSEREDDISFYKGVVFKVLKREGLPVNYDNFHTNTVGTNILKGIEEKTVYFFEGIEKIDVAFYFTDYDDGSCVEKIKEWYEDRLEPIVFCFPNPHLEKWMCAEQDAVKNVFGIEGNESLDCSPNPKDHIHRLIRDSDDITKIARHYYEEIGKCINIKKLEDNDRAFREMVRNLRLVEARENLT